MARATKQVGVQDTLASARQVLQKYNVAGIGIMLVGTVVREIKSIYIPMISLLILPIFGLVISRKLSHSAVFSSILSSSFTHKDMNNSRSVEMLLATILLIFISS